MTLTPTKKFFEKNIEPCVDKNLGYKQIKKAIKEKNKFFDLSELKNELTNFLAIYDSKNNSINSWRTFVKLLLEVLEECPVIYEGNKIKKLSIENSKNIPTFRIHLKFKLKNRKNIIKIKLKNL